MRGSIFRRGKGWSVVISLGKALDGTYPQQWYTVYGNREDAEAFLTARLRELDQGSFTRPSKMRVSELAERWQRDYCAVALKATTQAQYEQMLRLHILPALGAVRLDRLNPLRVQELLSDLARGNLSPKTVRHVKTVLHRMLAHAVKWGLAAQNAADDADTPRLVQSEPQRWTEKQARVFLELAGKHRLAALWHLALVSGMRKGELTALRWRDLDLEAEVLVVRRSASPVKGKLVEDTTKTVAGHRTIALPVSVVAALRRHNARQGAERIKLGLGRSEYVFTGITGKPLNPRAISRTLDLLTAKAKVPRVTFHGLRHVCASLLVAQGVTPKVVGELLGHTDISTTLGVYAHSLPGHQREAVTLLDRLLTGTEQAH